MISKRFSAACAVILFAGALSFLAAANSKTETWKGYVTDTWCGLHRETEAPTVACTNLCLSNKGAKYALYDVVNNKLYVLNPQEQAAKYAAKLVIVTGTLAGSRSNGNLARDHFGQHDCRHLNLGRAVEVEIAFRSRAASTCNSGTAVASDHVRSLSTLLSQCEFPLG